MFHNCLKTYQLSWVLFFCVWVFFKNIYIYVRVYIYIYI